MQDRIGDAEDKIGQLQSQQVILADKQVEIETKLHEELRRVEATFLETVKTLLILVQLHCDQLHLHLFPLLLHRCL